MSFTGPIEDRLAIRELYGTYGDASWRGDREAWIACFTSDGKWTSHLFDCTGHDELRATWNDLWKDWEAVAFLGEIGAIEIDGDTATCRSYAREVVQLKAGGVFKLCGRYDDRVVRQDGQWRFARRDYTLTIPELPG
ncbi:nuclear transport factor 2 family protein [Novosphingobium album (ex Liu et al. 2023)]|uniref:Nuclear transport factor 2 family protein n=1 Tax=Novosphingobium album (ex Liu et al. 2023) TaxID=3031130 RepID=A0ABT5WM59_9SPHN|nr:nuclear transport factor 2 family protein [Novosphingobium album (ex Liu et al. 2023)]MDE8651140.1 nuclear transport factor 2 family protein [Novosphingobium album (ex Liu et al. 2023)]